MLSFRQHSQLTEKQKKAIENLECCESVRLSVSARSRACVYAELLEHTRLRLLSAFVTFREQARVIRVVTTETSNLPACNMDGPQSDLHHSQFYSICFIHERHFSQPITTLAHLQLPARTDSSLDVELGSFATQNLGVSGDSAQSQPRQHHHSVSRANDLVEKLEYYLCAKSIDSFRIYVARQGL